MSADRHGTATCYVNHGCRRPECRAAASEYRRNLRRQNPEKARESARRYREANPEKIRAQRARHRARKLAAAGAATEAARIAQRTAAAPFTDLLETRDRALSLAIARSPRGEAGIEARHRRAEIRALLAHLTAEVDA